MSRAGGHFEFPFNQAGTYRYHCTIHPSIVGEIDVRRVILGPLPTAAVPVGDRVEFTGRTADPSKRVRIQRTRERLPLHDDRAARRRPRTAPGRLRSAPRRPATTAQPSAPTSARSRRMIVGDPQGRRSSRRAPASSVSVTPSAPYAPLLVEVYLRERFGWWPVARAPLDYVSEAEIRLRVAPPGCGSSWSTGTAGRRSQPAGRAARKP